MGAAAAPPPPPPGSPPPVFDLSYMQSTTKDKYDGMDLPSLYPAEPVTLSAAMCIGHSLPASLRTLLPRMPRHDTTTDEEANSIVSEILEAAEPCEEAYTDAEQLEEGKLYTVAEWSACLINKANLVFMSIEQHFEIGHLRFELTEAHVKGRIVGPEKVFVTEQAAIEHVRSFLAPGDVDGDDHSEGGSETLDPEYWDDLFDSQTERVTEWLVSYPSIKQYLLPLLKPTHATLVVGCGNSELSKGLHDDLLDEVTSMDVSQVVVEQMRVKYKDSPKLKWDTEDILHMSYKDDSFDVVIDKSLLDCIFHCEQYEEKVAEMLEELHRVLRKDTGLVVFFTIQNATEVLPFLETCKRGSWKCQVDTIKVETDCLGNVPCNARTAIGDNQLDPGVKRSKVFQLYVCHPLSSPVESKSKRQRTRRPSPTLTLT